MLPWRGSGPMTTMSLAGKPASRRRLAMASAATVVLPLEWVVLMSINCWKMSRASCLSALLSWACEVKEVNKRRAMVKKQEPNLSMDPPATRKGHCTRGRRLAIVSKHLARGTTPAAPGGGAPGLFSDAESAEDEAEDVVGSGGAGDFVERAQGVVEVKQQHLMGHALGHCGRGSIKSLQGILHQAAMAGIGQKSAFDLRALLAAHLAQDLGPEFGDAGAGEGGGAHGW